MYEIISLSIIISSYTFKSISIYKLDYLSIYLTHIQISTTSLYLTVFPNIWLSIHLSIIYLLLLIN